MEITLADALLRRKELQQKVQLTSTIKNTQAYYEVRGERKKVTEGLDEISANFPKLQLNQVTREYDFYAKQLRMIDSVIQNANWTTKIQADDIVMQDFKE